MKKFITLLIITMISAGCVSHKNATSGSSENTSGTNIGDSFENAIVIKENNESSGVAAEYKWIAKHYPSWSVASQALTFHEKKAYDIITIKKKGNTKKIYFDISNFFGKF